MFTENICKFIPTHNSSETINTLNFVYETNPSFTKNLSINAVYTMYVVASGEGLLHLPQRSHELKSGTLFFTFPTSPFTIESTDNLRYIYISFIGCRAAKLTEKLSLRKNCVFPGFDFLLPFWFDSLKISDSSTVDLISESVVLYTFSHITRKHAANEHFSQTSNTVLTVKKYIDEHFSDCDLSLQSLCKRLSYNPKYISSIFKRQIGTGFNEYLRTIRMQQACELIKKGFTCVGEIAVLCGYRDSLYFSKSFKDFTGVSPTIRISGIKRGMKI